MNHLAPPGVDSGVGPAGNRHANRALQEKRQSLFHGSLNGAKTGLQGPPIERAAVVGKIQPDTQKPAAPPMTGGSGFSFVHRLKSTVKNSVNYFLSSAAGASSVSAASASAASASAAGASSVSAASVSTASVSTTSSSAAGAAWQRQRLLQQQRPASGGKPARERAR